jgi:hypothetical protein
MDALVSVMALFFGQTAMSSSSYQELKLPEKGFEYMAGSAGRPSPRTILLLLLLGLVGGGARLSSLRVLGVKIREGEEVLSLVAYHVL